MGQTDSQIKSNSLNTPTFDRKVQGAIKSNPAPFDPNAEKRSMARNNAAIAQVAQQMGQERRAKEAEIAAQQAEKESFIANPYTVDPSQMKEMEYRDFSNQRQMGLNDINSASNSGYQTTLSNMSSRGGLRAADQLAAGNELAKSLTDSRTRFNLGMNEMQANDRYNVDRANAQMMNDLNFYNADANRGTDRFNVGNKWRGKMWEEGLEREDKRLEQEKLSAEELAKIQAEEANRDPGILEDPSAYAGNQWEKTKKEISSWF